jgi:hypothetical protein
VLAARSEEPGCALAHAPAVEERASDDEERCEEREAEREAEFARGGAVRGEREAAVGGRDAFGLDAAFRLVRQRALESNL